MVGRLLFVRFVDIGCCLTMMSVYDDWRQSASSTRRVVLALRRRQRCWASVVRASMSMLRRTGQVDVARVQSISMMMTTSGAGARQRASARARVSARGCAARARVGDGDARRARVMMTMTGDDWRVCCWRFRWLLQALVWFRSASASASGLVAYGRRQVVVGCASSTSTFRRQASVRRRLSVSRRYGRDVRCCCASLVWASAL